MLLEVLGRRDLDGCAEMRRLIQVSHETPVKKKEMRRRGFALFKGLVQGGVLTVVPKSERTGPWKVELHIDMQEDFSMHQALGLWLLDAIPQLDAEDGVYPLNRKLVEAILEDPVAVIRKQLDKAKGLAELKADGVEYDERGNARADADSRPSRVVYDLQRGCDRSWARGGWRAAQVNAREMVERHESRLKR